ncbi:hypothetical protein [Rhizobium herbae]
MTTGRKIVQSQLGILLSVFVATTTPYTMKVSGFTLELAPHSVFAKDGNNGNGNGGGNRNSGGNGNSGGIGGAGNGGGKDNSGAGKSETRGNSQGAKDQGSKGKTGSAGLSVRHSDGISEVVRNGRYIMKDSKGRTIVNRQATLADEIRLRFLH